MTTKTQHEAWVPFPGGELEGRPPRLMCRACRDRATGNGTLCFDCYRAGLDREQRLKRAAALDTASEARFQETLPLEPVDLPRLNRLRAERTMARAALAGSHSATAESRIRRAQMAARASIEKFVGARPSRFVTAFHAAELQLPESWLPFVAASR